MDATYIDTLKDLHTGYTQLATLDIITHLYDTYGDITAYDLAVNNMQLNKPYDANQPISQLFKQIEEAGEFAAAAGSPFSDCQILDAAYLLVLKTNAYKDDCKS